MAVARIDARAGRVWVLSQGPRAAQAPSLSGLLSHAASPADAPRPVICTLEIPTGPAQAALAAAAFPRGSLGSLSGGSVWATVDARGLGDQGFVVHPAVADAAVHAGAVLRARTDTGSMVTVALGCYAAQHGLHGALPDSSVRLPAWLGRVTGISIVSLSLHKLPLACMLPVLLHCQYDVFRHCTWTIAGDREAHVCATLRPGGPTGATISNHQVAASSGSNGGSAGPCVAIGGVQARLLAAEPSPAPPAAAAALPPARSMRMASAGGGAPARAVTAGPDPCWVPVYEPEDAGAAVAAAVVQLPPATAPLPPEFESEVATMPIRRVLLPDKHSCVLSHHPVRVRSGDGACFLPSGG